jgi:hypothetical protein
MACADCHTTDGVNTTTGNAHGSASEYLLKSATGTAAEGTSTATVVCARCHLASNYASTGGHAVGDSADWVWTTSAVGTARSASRGNILGMACTNCHGGQAPSKAGVTFPANVTGVGGFGTIHGTSQVIGIGNAGGAAGSAYRAAYRFTNGNSMRYYNPGTWSGGTRTCYTLSTADTWGACTQHGSGTSGTPSAAGAARPLSY